MADTATKTKDTPQTRATLKYLRTSPYKVREVLDLIRGLDVDDARHVLQFSERGAARDVLKLLNSAVANADHTLNIPADELKVAVAYADEGPTIKRWRPRARGRATRIRKRTSHVTIVVARLSDNELQARRRRDGAATTQRRRGVIPGRRRKAAEEAAPKTEEGRAAEASGAEVEPGPPDDAEAEAEALEDESGGEIQAVAEEPVESEEERAARYASLGGEEAAAQEEQVSPDEAVTPEDGEGK